MTTSDSQGVRRAIRRLPLGSLDSLRPVAQAFCARSKAMFIGVADEPLAILLATSADSNLDSGKLLKVALNAVSGRGGGSPRLAQGSAPTLAALEQALTALSASRPDRSPTESACPSPESAAWSDSDSSPSKRWPRRAKVATPSCSFRDTARCACSGTSCNRGRRWANSIPRQSSRDSDRPLRRPLQRREETSSRCGRSFKLVWDRASYVPRNRGIDLQAPAFDAALHTAALFHTLFPQPTDYLQAAHSVMAEYDQRRLFRFERRQRLRNAAHRNELAALNARLLVFKWLTNIHQPQLFARVEPLFHFPWCDLEWRCHFPSLARFLPPWHWRYHYELGSDSR